MPDSLTASYSSAVVDRAVAALAEARSAFAEIRLRLAIERDNRLTDQELGAMLEVWQEFGR